MSAVEKYAPPITEIQTWAEKFAESGMFTDARQVMQAFVKISAGAELGLTPFQSMTGVHIIQGKPVVGAGLLASLLDRDPAYDYTVEWDPDEKNPSACTVTVLKNGSERGRSRFSLDDAKRAGLTGGNWTKYPASMLFARAMSNAVRWYAPGATGTSVYVEGEIVDDAPAPAPALVGVKPKERARVTAEVVPTPEPEREEVIQDADLDYEPVSYDLSADLKAMSLQDRADLYEAAGIPKGTKLADVKALLVAHAETLGLEYTDEPDPRSILAATRIARVTDGDADSFDHYARTGQDLDVDPQTAIA